MEEFKSELTNNGNIKFVDSSNVSEDDCLGNISVFIVGFNKRNIGEESRQRIFDSYEAFLASNDNVGNNDESVVGKIVGSFTQKGKENLDAMEELVVLSDQSTCLCCSKGKAAVRFNFYSGLEKHAGLISTYCSPGCVYNKGIILVDGFCDSEVKEGIYELINEGKLSRDRVVLIMRPDRNDVYNAWQNGVHNDWNGEYDDWDWKEVRDPEATSKLARLLPKGNFIMETDLKGLSAKAKELYLKAVDGLKLIPKEQVLKEQIFTQKQIKEQKESKFRELFGTVNEHKGKLAAGVLTFFGLEELWRNGLFGGKETNEKTKDNKYLPKVFEKKK